MPSRTTLSDRETESQPCRFRRCEKVERARSHGLLSPALSSNPDGIGTGIGEGEGHSPLHPRLTDNSPLLVFIGETVGDPPAISLFEIRRVCIVAEQALNRYLSRVADLYQLLFAVSGGEGCIRLHCL